MVDRLWISAEQQTIDALLEARLEHDPEGPYLDVCGVASSASDVDAVARRVAAALATFGVDAGDRVAILVENSPEAVLAWWGAVRAGAVAVPVNTAYKGDFLRHQLADCGARVVIVAGALAGHLARVVGDLPAVAHVVVIGDGADLPGAAVHSWADVVTGADEPPARRARPADLATFVYTGGTTGPSKGCMLSHNYHVSLARQIGVCWQRRADDVVWTPLPLFHLNAIVTAVLGPLVHGGRAAIDRRFSVSRFWPEISRVGATITSTLGSMAYLVAHDADRPEMPRSGARTANTSLRLIAAVPLPEEVDRVLRERFGVATFSGGYGVTEASLVSWQPPGVAHRPGAAGVVNDEYFDVRIFSDDDEELPPGAAGEIVVRPRRPHTMFEGYWGRPEATVAANRNLWFHTGDVGRVDADGYLFFVDRKADYLRRRGENISSYEVERVLLRHGALADVAVHAVPSPLTEDDLKVTATLVEGAALTEEELYRWCVEELPSFALPRYIEFRAALPRSPVGRVLKRHLRAEPPAPTWWDAENL